ncbi:MAG: hypothetical protein VB853_01015, partial [Pirellulales bacterium]
LSEMAEAVDPNAVSKNMHLSSMPLIYQTLRISPHRDSSAGAIAVTGSPNCGVSAASRKESGNF